MKVVEDYRSLPLFDRSKWQRVRFGDVVKQIKEQVDPEADGIERYVAGEHMETEDVHIRKWGTLGEGYLGPAFIRGFRKGQVLYGSRRTYLKKVAVTEWDGVTANTTFVLEAVEGKMLQELLPWLMLSERFTKHSVQESKGSTNPYINFPDIAKFEFDLPPLDHQRRIAEILWAVDEVQERFLNLLQTATDAIKANKLEFLAECRAKTPQESLTSVCEPTQWQTIAQNQLKESGIPVFGANGYIGYYDEANHSADVIAITCRGSTCGTVNWIPGPSYITGNSMCLEKITDRLKQRFLYEVLLETNMRTVITGSAQPQITRNSLAALKVPMPPLQEQETWLIELSKLQAAKEQASTNAEAVKRMSEALREEAIAP